MIHLHHTHLMASDADTTVGFWIDCFDAEVVSDTTLAGARNILIDVGGGRLNLYDQPPNSRGVVNHVGVQVDDLETVLVRLTDAGWQPGPAKTDGSLRYAMVEGPDQLLVEVFQIDTGSVAAELAPFFSPRGTPPSVEGDRSVPDPMAPDRSSWPDAAGPDLAGLDLAGLGAGRLSSQANARLRQPAPAPLRPPPADDHRAVTAWRRSIHQQWLAGDPPAEAVGHEERFIGGVRCLVTETPQASVFLVYAHGGGFALGSPEVALPITTRLTGRATAGPSGSIAVVSVDYRLAPEHPFPAAVDDVGAVISEVTAQSEDVAVVLAGDSAGANIVLAAALRLRPRDSVRGLVLFSPHLDLVPVDAGAGPGLDPRSDLDDPARRWLAEAYADGRDLANPELSPLRADLSGLPPTLVQVGGRDSALPQAVRFNRLARAVGVDATLDVWEGMWHTWHYHRGLPEADRALAEASDFARRCVR